MVGTQGDRTLSQAYLLNEFGSAFVLGDGEVKSGFAYFLSSDSSAPSKLRINKGMMGDVNGDGEINVTDVMFMVDYVLTGYDINFEAAYADLNNDKVITVADVALLVEIILK